MEETLDQIQARHRKEQKDLQSRITSKRKNATKKTRKGVNDECAQLVLQLKERQNQELVALTGGNSNGTAGLDDDDDVSDSGAEGTEPPPTDDNTIANGLAQKLGSTSISQSQPTPSAEPIEPKKKRNRQKERMARRAAEQEAAAIAAEEEAANMTDHKKIEKTYMLKEFKANGLVEQDIQPDGHCLFSAVADQLQQRSIPLSSTPNFGGGEAPAGLVQAAGGSVLPYKTVRQVAATFMKAHEDDFAPFMEEPLDSHVAKIRDTAEWGGQLELQALARAYNIEISVVQEGRTELIEPTTHAHTDATSKKELERIWLAYYRHGYGLGEHYNSLRKQP